ncbi:MAG TPA: FHA domain-containing protein [Myxococcota bacterium]|nr:FHA domain-containing protein [Myxococcota bacterium]
MGERPRMFQLVSSTVLYPLLPGEWLIGRAPHAGIAVADPLASREHTVLRVGPELVEVEDLGSRNGTFVNGARLSAPTPMYPGDTLRIGDTEYRLEESTEDPSDLAALLEGNLTDDPPTPTAVRFRRRPGPPPAFGEATHIPRARDRAPFAPVRPAPAAPAETGPKRTALLVLGDADWAEQIQRAAAIHANLRVLLCAPAEADTAIAAVGKGVLLMDLEAAGAQADGLLAAWAKLGTRGPALVASSQPEHDGVVLAREMGVAGYVRIGKPSILVVAQLRFQLQRTESQEDGTETDER